MEKKRRVNSTPSKRKAMTVEEIRTLYNENDKRTALYEAAKNALPFIDLTKTETRTFTIYSKENLRSFMRNPKSNENNLRNLSRFLYRVSHPYRRLINYNAHHIDLSAMTIIPSINFLKDPNKDSVLKNYYNTCVEVEKLKMESEIYKCAVIAWREDCFYGYVYEDDTGFFIMPLDGNYCKVSSTNYDGTLNLAFDFSYFKRRQEQLEYWDEEFEQKYNIYDSDTSKRWQELDPSRTICLKINSDDPTLCVPPYLAMFEQIIDNVDRQSMQSVKDELSIYKLLVARLKPISGSKDPDDFEVDPDTAIDYYYKFEESLPECVSAALSPLPIDVIDFKGNTTEETDMIANSMSNLFKSSGGSLVLNDEKTGASIYRAHQIADMTNALIPILDQIQNWVNRYLSYVIGDHAKVKYIKTSPWLKSETRKELLESAQYGVPVKMALASLNGFSPLEVLSMQFFENDCLSLHDKWIPLQSSYTMSSDTKEKDQLTDEGELTREKEKNLM